MSIPLHEEHGVNPMLTNCFVCNESKGVALMGKMTKKMRNALEEAGVPADSSGRAPHQGVVMDREPCTKCEEYMAQGIIVISVNEELSEDMQNPYRTGGWCVMSEDWVKRVVTPDELQEDILKKRLAFIPDDAWDMLGLPRG